MKRNALSVVNSNLSRAEQLAQWKEAKSQSADVKKRSHPADFDKEDLKKKIKKLQSSVLEKDHKVRALNSKIETYQATIDSLSQNVKRLQEKELKLEADNSTLTVTIQQLKEVIKKSVAEHERNQELIRDLHKKCDEIPMLQSHVTELALLNRCLQAPGLTEPSAKATESPSNLSNLIADNGRLKQILKSEKAALKAEIRALQSKNASLTLRCDELNFNYKILLQQNAELLENAMKYVAKKEKENRSEREAERNELTSAMTSMEAELTEALDKSMTKIAELQQEIAGFRKRLNIEQID